MRQTPGTYKLELLEQLIERDGMRLDGARLGYFNDPRGKKPSTILITPDTQEEGAWGWEGESIHDAHDFLKNYGYLVEQ